MPYSGDPSASAADMVRFLLGDTDTANVLLTDSEITALLTIHSDEPYAAAIAAAKSLAARYARRVDKRVGDLSISWSQVSKNFRDLAVQLSNQHLSISDALAPYAGGISVSDKAANAADTDVVQPYFRVGMHDTISRETSSED